LPRFTPETAETGAVADADKPASERSLDVLGRNRWARDGAVERLQRSLRRHRLGLFGILIGGGCCGGLSRWSFDGRLLRRRVARRERRRTELRTRTDSLAATAPLAPFTSILNTTSAVTGE